MFKVLVSTPYRPLTDNVKRGSVADAPALSATFFTDTTLTLGGSWFQLLSAYSDNHGRLDRLTPALPVRP